MKLAGNLKTYNMNKEIIFATLELLQDLSQGYNSAKLLLKLDTM